MKIAILTSSRADFGIYLPLLNALHTDPFFEMEIIAFGPHLSKQHGFTINEIEKTGFSVKHSIESLLPDDAAASIAKSYALTTTKFADFWANHQNEFDWVFCLGDRFEMAAAVLAGIPLNVRFAHIHGGETTLGAIDNIYRHSITLASNLHFVSTEIFADRIRELNGPKARCIVTGSLSLDNLNTISFLSKESFLEKWGIDLNSPSILTTIHPETFDFEKNESYAKESIDALAVLTQTYQIIITMPNADTSGSVFRKAFFKLKSQIPGRIHLIENFGTQSYFTCIRYASFLLGNTSSGIIEAASFGKYVINLGDRQKGRLAGKNVLHVPFNSTEIVKAAVKLRGKSYDGENIYFKANAAQTIIRELKNK